MAIRISVIGDMNGPGFPAAKTIGSNQAGFLAPGQGCGIRLGGGDDRLVNTGDIEGDILLGDGAGAVVMVAVFASTGGLTGGEVAVAGGTTAVGQRVLEAAPCPVLVTRG